MSDIAITAANVQPGANAVTGRGIAGATVTAGQGIYLDANDGDMAKPAVSDEQLSQAAAEGIALHGASRGQPLEWQEDGPIVIGGTVEIGQVYVVSPTAAGGIAPYEDLGAGNAVTIYGVGKTASQIEMALRVFNVQIPTPPE